MNNIKNYLKQNELLQYRNNYYNDHYYNLYSIDVSESKQSSYFFENVEISFDNESNNYTLRFDKKDSITVFMILAFDLENCTSLYNDVTYVFEINLENFLIFLDKSKTKNVIVFDNLDYETYSCVLCGVLGVENKNTTINRSIGLALEKWDNRS